MWEYNGQPLAVEDWTDVQCQRGEGTLIIKEALAQHEGVYQCFAINPHGTALSIKTELNKACMYTKSMKVSAQ